MKINDWSSIQSLFDDLNKCMEKARKVTNMDSVPHAYVKLLVELEVREGRGGWRGGRGAGLLRAREGGGVQC